METLTLQDLALRGRNLPGECTVSLGDAGALTCDSVLRLLPGKRLACRASWQGRTVLAKLFFDPAGWQRHLAREVAGCRALASAGVATPDVLAEGQAGTGGWLLFEYLEHSTSLEDAWAACLTDADRLPVLERAMVAVAALHLQGLYQDDIHLGNFLLSDERVYCIDGASVVQRCPGKPLAAADAARNLALLIAQLFPRHEMQARQSVDAYREVVGDAIPVPDPDLQEAITVQRRQRATHFAGKLFRDCTQFECHRSWRWFLVAERDRMNDRLRTWIADPDVPFSGGPLLKDGNTATVCRMPVAGQDLIVKRYNIKSLWHGLLRAFQPSRAWISWRNGHLLRHFGLPTPQPLILLERRWGWLRNRAWLVTDAVTGPHALEALSAPDIAATELDRAVAGIRAIFLGMVATRFSHGDLKATNILMGPNGPVLIDLDAAQQHRDARAFAKAFRKDLARFQRNWPAGGPAEKAFAPVVREMEELLDQRLER